VKKYYVYSFAILLLMYLHATPLYKYRLSEKDNWKKAAKYLDENIKKKDIVFVMPKENEHIFYYYLNKLNNKNIRIKSNFKFSKSKRRFIWLVSYLEEAWYYELYYKDLYEEYKAFRNKLEILDIIEFKPHPTILKAVNYNNKIVQKVDMHTLQNANLTYHKDYNILHPKTYNQKGSFNIDIQKPVTDFSKAYIKIRAHLIYDNNYIEVSVNGNIKIYKKGIGKENRILEYIDVTELLENNDKIILNVVLFTDTNTSHELFDTRIEELLFIYESK